MNAGAAGGLRTGWWTGLWIAWLCLSANAQDYDLILRHGRLVDGAGNPAFFADLAVKAGRIAAIGKVNGTAKTEIEARGWIVAPGFIDVHTHADDLADFPRAENFVRMGVTTIVVGNCGGSTLEVGRFFRDVERTNLAINVASLIGHNDVRRHAMGGSFDRPPTPKELSAMKALVDRAMREGAVGLSTGLIYLPGAFSKTDEIVELAKVIAPYDGLYASHMRHEDNRIYQALDEVFRVAREAGVRAEVSHLKLAGPSAWGQAERVLDAIEKARASGLDITQDQYAYTASSTGLSQLIPDAALEGGHPRFLERLADPARKAEIVAEMKRSLVGKGRQDYAYAVIASCQQDPSLNGLNLVQAAQAKRGAATLQDQIEMILEIQKNGGASGVFHGMDEEDLKVFMRHPNTLIACDSGIRQFGEGVPHPRGYGNNARVLAHYVRELKVLHLEEAIRKMTSLPASTFHFKERGELREGYWADLVVLDPDQVQDHATYADPHHYPTGIPFVIVNGVVVIDKGEHTGAKAGRALRHQATPGP